MTGGSDLDLKLYDLGRITDALEKLSHAGIYTDNIIVGSHRVHVSYVEESDVRDVRATGYWVINRIERVHK